MTSRLRRRLSGAARLAAYRAAFGVGELLDPARAAQRAAELWFTPPSATTRAAAEPRSSCRGFRLAIGEHEVVGTIWGSGPPVYFVHGWGGRGLQVRAMVDPLVAAGLSVIAFDGPSHVGGPRTPTHAGELGRVLAGVVGHHGAPHGLVAHSLGAVALARAVATDGLPVPRLLLIAPVADGAEQLERFARVLRLGPRIRRRLADEVQRQTGLALEAFSLWSLVDSVEGGRVAIVHDRVDTFAPYAASVALARRWHGARLFTTEGLGHQRLLHDPAVISTAVELLSETPGTATAGRTDYYSPTATDR